MKVKIDNVDLSIVISCLDQMREQYADDVQRDIDMTILSLGEIYDHIKPGRRKKIKIGPAERRLIVQCLIDWRNLFLSEGENVKAEVISETLLAFYQ